MGQSLGEVALVLRLSLAETVKRFSDELERGAATTAAAPTACAGTAVSSRPAGG
jgi:hypothetical protein